MQSCPLYHAIRLFGICVCIAALASCSSEKKTAVKSAAKGTIEQTTSETTSTEVSATATPDVDYIKERGAERYVSPDERLKRRQNRIKGVLDTDPPTPVSAI